MKRLDTPKRVFTYTVGDDITIFGISDLPSHTHMQPVYDNWLVSQMDYERDWRNYELDSTDWMLVSDATYEGIALVDSTRLDEILIYRSSLRNYNLTTDDRPIRPTWYTVNSSSV